MIFLDTDILSYHFKSNENVTNRMLESVEQGNQLCITVINAYEVLKGLRSRNNQRIEKGFNFLINRLKMYSLDENVINLAADIYAELQKKGKKIGDSDILIAAIVIANNGILITNNLKHFDCIERLKMENWI